ncbi:hypothetical protein QQ045_021221 [Rhodiola kirilowii]
MEKTSSCVKNHQSNTTEDIIRDAFTFQYMPDEDLQMNMDRESDDLDSRMVFERYKSLVGEAQTPLYIGCNRTVLETILRAMQVKVESRVSDKGFNKILQITKEILPLDNNYPSYYKDVKKVLKNMGLGYETIHACEHGCILYYKEHKDRITYLVCGEGRYRENESNNKVPKKTLKYFPLTPILQRLYMSPDIVAHMRWHALKNVEDPDYNRHPADGESWQLFDKEYTEFSTVISTISDFPGLGMLGGLKTKGYKACPLCLDDIDATHLTGRMSYQGHRRWLPRDHDWRFVAHRFNEKFESRYPPPPLVGPDIFNVIMSHEYPTLSLHPQFKARGNIERLCRTHVSIFYELPYWKSFSHPYVIHIEKNVFDNIFGTILGIEGKTKDDIKARKVTPNEKLEILEYIKDAKYPSGYAGSLKNTINLEDKNRLLPVYIRPYLPRNVVDPLISLSHWFRRISCRQLGNYKKFVRNTRYPEGCIAVENIAQECVMYCKLYMGEIEGKSHINDEDKEDYFDISVVSNVIKPTGCYNRRFRLNNNDI